MNHNQFLRRPSSPPPDLGDTKYDTLGLRDNPFPQAPSLNPYSDDPRINGEIYSDDLHVEQEERFMNLLVPRPGNRNTRRLVYLMDLASRRGRGIGKSAFLQRQNARIMDDLGNNASEGEEVLFSVVVTPNPSVSYKRFGDFCKLIVEALVSDGIVALALARIRALSGLVHESRLSEITSLETFKTSLLSDAWLDQNNDADIWNAPSRHLVQYIKSEMRRANLPAQMAETFANADSTEALQKHWLDEISPTEWRRSGSTILFDWLPKLFRLASFSHGLLLIDELEKVVTPMNQPEMRAFAECLRQALFDGNNSNCRTGFFAMLLTVHPYIQELLSPHWEGAGLDRLAPLQESAGTDFRIDFPPLDMRMATPLVAVYLDRFRSAGDGAEGGLAPFTEQAVVEALNQSGRLPGITLGLLHRVIETAAREGVSEVSEALVVRVAGGNTEATEDIPGLIERLPGAVVGLSD